MQRLGGHFARQVLAYTSEFSGLGLNVGVFHNRNWDEPPRENWAGYFQIPDHVAGVGKVNDEAQLQSFSEYFERCFAQCIDRNNASLAVFPTIRFLTIRSAVAAVENSAKTKGAILGIMETAPVPDSDNDSLVRSAFEHAAKNIRQSHKEYLIVAESAPIRGFLAESGFPEDLIHTHPYPAANRFKSKPVLMRPRRSPRFTALGGLRQIQNPHTMAQYLMTNESDDVDWTFRLNFGLLESLLGIKEAGIKNALYRENVRLIDGELESKQYDQILKNSDALVLPYGERYQTIGSGVFLEALCAGVIPLVPAQSTMRQLYLELGGMAPAIKEISVSGIANAVSDCHANFSALRKNARELRQRWLNHKNGPLAWRESIRQLAEQVFFGGRKRI
jgi:hypothetical protein